MTHPHTILYPVFLVLKVSLMSCVPFRYFIILMSLFQSDTFGSFVHMHSNAIVG